MKNIGIFICLAFCFNVLTLYGQYQSVTIQTPTGVNVDAFRFTGTDFTAQEIAAENYYWTNGYNCRILANSTRYYNCHGYAWYNIEGRMGQSDLRWINDVDDYGNPISNVTKYYTGADKSYNQTTTVANHLRVSYFPRDHSAVTTEDQDSVISKWASGPLVKHTLSQCPFYPYSQIKYYKLAPKINGSTSLMCDNDQRTFTSNMSIAGSTYTWSRSTSVLDYVSGAGTTSYSVEANNGSGDAYVSLQITTPSGEVAESNKSLYVGVPVITYISGSTYTPNYQWATYYAEPNDPLMGANDYNWILNPLLDNVVYDYGWTTDIAFYSSGNYQLLVRAQNTCGWGDYTVTGVEVYDSKLLSVSPNPASEFVTVTTKSGRSGLKVDDYIQEYSIQITDLYGGLHFSGTRSGESFTIPVHNLKNGYYIIRIDDGKTKTGLKLIVKH